MTEANRTPLTRSASEISVRCARAAALGRPGIGDACKITSVPLLLWNVLRGSACGWRPIGERFSHPPVRVVLRKYLILTRMVEFTLVVKRCIPYPHPLPLSLHYLPSFSESDVPINTPPALSSFPNPSRPKFPRFFYLHGTVPSLVDPRRSYYLRCRILGYRWPREVSTQAARDRARSASRRRSSAIARRATSCWSREHSCSATTASAASTSSIKCRTRRELSFMRLWSNRP